MSTSATKRVGFYSSDQEEPAGVARSSGAAGIWEQLAASTVIAAVNSPEQFPIALDAPTQTIYLLTGTPLSVPQFVAQARERGKACLVNIDFIEGLSRDKHAVEYLAAHKVEGIVSTRMDILRAAKAQGLITVQRTFAIDSAAVQATVRSLAQFKPDAVEILPAVAAPRVLVKFRELYPTLQIVAGGLIEGIQEIESLLAAGVNSISVSNPRLWVV